MAKWIWLDGDFEIYHNLQLHMRRDEYDYQFPPFWHLDTPEPNVVFRKECDTAEDGMIEVTTMGRGMLEIDGRRYPLNCCVPVQKGRHVIEAKVMSTELPCMLMTGVIETDETWLCCTYGGPWQAAGTSPLFAPGEDTPLHFPFARRELEPRSVEEVDGGYLYDMGREVFAEVWQEPDPDGWVTEATIRFGESREEALSEKAIVQQSWHEFSAPMTECCAFRYFWVDAEMDLTVTEHLADMPCRGYFRCSDEEINRIWQVSKRTFHLCSREFFLDGIKRDRWVWSGDAYQSAFINRYSFADADIVRRTLVALRGKDRVYHHINTILDYSFYWIMALADHYEATGDIAFIRRMYGKAESLMAYCLARLDENGFAVNEGNGWVFIDWADMDKEYAVCAEQMLLTRALQSMANLAKLTGWDGSGYLARYEQLRTAVDAFFWDEEKGAYIDSYASGKRNVTRHANIFALLFGYADDEKRRRIMKNVLFNDDVPAISTPYFKYYELDALCQAGDLTEVLRRMRAYWGAMLREGATTFWEEFDPKKKAEAQYGMYGDPFGKSQCHAWGASPIYLLGRWYLGVRPTSPGWETFEVAPQLGGLRWMEGAVPLPGGHEVRIQAADEICKVFATCDGGTLCWKGEKYDIIGGAELTIL